jgi:hypothetical protein
MRLLISLIIAVAAMQFCGTARAQGDAPLILTGTKWAISVEPNTLRVTGIPTGGRPLTISDALTDPHPIADLKQQGGLLSWRVPSENLAVAIGLEAGDVLTVNFTSTAKQGAVAWPVLGMESARAWILPMFEGLYVPADDQQWGTYLTKQEGVNTTSGLSMPFWGIDCGGGQTLTYILTNPFNNELTFRWERERTQGTFAHAFTRNHDVNECGFRIHLGGASPVEPARIYRRHLIETGQFVSMSDKIKRTPDAAKLLGAAHVYLWGDGWSAKMIQAFSDGGLDRLWLGSPDWAGLRDHPDVVQKAIALGYLVGPYDSFHSIHSPAESDTWETAQFDQKLYEIGAVVKVDGTKKTGFKKKGYILNCAVARPYVERRVTDLMKEFRCNSWFVDCDADGELYDDYSPDHPATQAMDQDARNARMTWIRDTFGAVIGSEGGSSYAAGTIHFAHGMMTPAFGWGDAEMKDRASKYFLGAYYPPEGPAVFFKQVPMKPEYRRAFADAQFRLPLYQTVFHDSVVTTHQWGSASLKFQDDDHARELLELLYDVPPLYHLNLAAWRKQKDTIEHHYAFFSPLHRESALLAMTDFQWLTADRMVQQTTFGDKLERVANFSDEPFEFHGTKIPPHAIIVRRLDAPEKKLYQPTEASRQVTR